ncbi:MAG TPA: efflux RND transporter periplasmic adaptor subunit [Vicinamibacterales bacterium]|nr:efflux RND transporter periplasmic adaptor subunit [Vicinamibacterales bacterium]
MMLTALAAACFAGFELRDRLPGWALFAKPGVERGTKSGPVVYYQDPDGQPLYAATPRKTADGRPYRAVHASEDVGFDAMPAQAAAAPSGKRILYYRNPMGLPDVSPIPKKDSMGMDYIAVHEGEADDGDVIRLSPAKIQRSGVTTEPASMRVVSETLRAPGTIQLDERRVAVIALRAEAFVESVENVTTGAEVRKGQPLMRIYSPAISSAAAEYAAVERMSGARNSGGSRQKLLNMGMPESAIVELERTGKAPLAFVLTAPRDGVVLERAVTEGMRATTGDVLFRIADHSAVWALIDVPEARLGAVANGQPVKVRARAYPERVFPGTIALVYPHLNAATRTVRLRIDLPNPGLALLPDMYVEAQIDTGASTPVLAVPDSAVLDSGDRQVVIVALGEGRFEPRPVKLGVRGGGYVEIRDGVRADELVVTSATFLLDAESNLKAALKGLAGRSVSQ